MPEAGKSGSGAEGNLLVSHFAGGSGRRGRIHSTHGREDGIDTPEHEICEDIMILYVYLGSSQCIFGVVTFEIMEANCGAMVLPGSISVTARR